MSETEQIICQFFVRAVSGAVALVVGTGLCYFLFIGGFLRRLEHYKERLRVYKDLDKRSAKVALNAGILRQEPAWVSRFGQEMDAFNEYVRSEDRLFMSVALRGHCQRVTMTAEKLMPDEYPEPPKTAVYAEERLFNLEKECKLLRAAIEDELETAHFPFPPGFVKWWAVVRGRLFS